MGGDEWSFGGPAYLAELLQDLRFAGLARAFRQERRALGTRQAFRRLVRYGLLEILPGWCLRAALGIRRTVTPSPTPAWKFRLNDRTGRAARNRVSGLADPPAVRRAGHRAALDMLFDARRAAARDSMNHLAADAGIECRDPLTSTTMVEFHFATPEWTRIDATGSRVVQRAALSGLLPDAVRLRTDKAEFSNTLRPHFDDLAAWNGGHVGKAASRWLQDGEFYRNVQLARADTNVGMSKWATWGLFGCSLLCADLCDELGRGASGSE